MNNQERKNEIKRRLILSQYPKRANATFDEENDHNPLILKECVGCRGYVMVDTYEKQGDVETWSSDECALCFGSGVEAELVRYFDNETPAIEVKMSVNGWVKCPCCGWKFALKDSRVWTGRRHKRCGQKLNILA